MLSASNEQHERQGCALPHADVPILLAFFLCRGIRLCSADSFDLLFYVFSPSAPSTPSAPFDRGLMNVFAAGICVNHGQRLSTYSRLIVPEKCSIELRQMKFPRSGHLCAVISKSRHTFSAWVSRCYMGAVQILWGRDKIILRTEIDFLARITHIHKFIAGELNEVELRDFRHCVQA